MGKSIPTGNVYDKKSAKNPIERFLVNGFDARLRRMMEKTDLSTTLEIGCGEGNNIAIIKEINKKSVYTGADIDKELLKLAKSRGADAVVYSDPDKPVSFKFKDRSFSTVVMVEVLEHLPDPRIALAEAARLCSDQFIASVPLEPLWRMMNMARGRYLSDLGNTPGHIRHWGPFSFKKLISEYFDIIEFHIQLPWIMLRAKKK